MLCRFLDALEAGAKSPGDLLEECLSRIRERDGEVQAWAAAGPQAALADGPLRGIPFGVKDIFDTRDLPTAFGSALYAGRRPERDAALVEQMRRAGAILLGKTHTAVFASFDPAPTRNPRAPERTPGGSSSGSAAAVADGMVPFALGTQTLGSVLRPASYCGVSGFKPTFGLLATEGVLAFAPSLDTAGLFTATAADMERLWSLTFGGGFPAPLRRAACFLPQAAPEMRSAFAGAVERLRASGFPVARLEVPPGFDRLLDAALAINDYEGARSHRERWREFGVRIGVKLAALVERGLELPEDGYRAAQEAVESSRREFRALFGEYPLLFTPAATGAAPLGLESTGDPAANAPWTALGVPAISIPMPVDGPPLGLQATAAWGADGALLSAASEVERLLWAGTV